MKFNEAMKLETFKLKAGKVIDQFPAIAGAEAVRHYTENFRKQGFDDSGVQKWDPRKRDRVRDVGRAILVKTGTLRRSFIWKQVGKLIVNIFSPLPYSRRQNDGGGGVTARQIIGYSENLNKKILTRMDQRIQAAR